MTTPFEPAPSWLGEFNRDNFPRSSQPSIYDEMAVALKERERQEASRGGWKEYKSGDVIEFSRQQGVPPLAQGDGKG